MNEIPASLLYSPSELERFLDETSTPLSDDEMRDYPTDEELEDMANIFGDYTLVNINAPF